MKNSNKKPIEVSNDRKNGKKPKSSPKTVVPTGRTVGGYSQEALSRRSARREPLTLQGLRSKS